MTDETLIRRLSSRIWNDREIDAGLLQVVIGIWLLLWPFPLGPVPGWAQLFGIAPPWVWSLVFLALGGGRLLLAPRRDRRLAARFALASCFCFWLLAASILFAQHRLLGGPLFAWLGYQGLKSYLRLSIAQRVRA